MEKEFNLSEKIRFGRTFGEKRKYKDVIKISDVKKFIKLLKERLQHYEQGEVGTFIDKLAGKDLKWN